MGIVEKDWRRQWAVLSFGTADITPREEFEAMLKDSASKGVPLRVKCGIDPTASSVHLGHSVPYRKMRQFQEFGHTGVVVIGDYTAAIGDPTGRDESRPPLSREDIGRNAEQYMEQIYRIVLKERTEIRYQSEWFGSVGLEEVISWASQTTTAKLLGHDTFKKRLEEGLPLSLHELLYPVLQGIDSVSIKADVELGGTDQRFNVLMGRDYQKHAGMRPQTAVLLPLLTGTCGTQKMSKSLGNTIGLLDEPFDQFGKVMSIPDRILLEYYEFLLGMDPEEFEAVKTALESGDLHPNTAKKDLGQRIVSSFWGDKTALEMRERFESVFREGRPPEDTPTYRYKRGETVAVVLTASGLLPSKKEVKRMTAQGAVRFVDGEKIRDEKMILDESAQNRMIKVGKRKFLKLL